MQKVSLAKIDLVIFSVINGYSKKSRSLDLFAIGIAEYVGYIALVLLFFYAWVIGSWQVFFIPLLVGILSRIGNEVIYFFYQRKRPLEVLPIVALIKKPNHPSFPSGHSAFFFAVSFALILFSLPLAVVGMVISFFVCVARIFCGVHWPSDILAGVGMAVLIFVVASQFV